MTTAKRTKRCPLCGGTIWLETRDDVLEYRGHQRTVRTLGWWCSSCGEGILEGPPLFERDRTHRQFIAEVKQLLGPNDVAEVREKHSMPQRAAG